MEKTLDSRLHRSLLTAVIQQMPAAVIVAAPDGHLLLGNSQVERIWGHPVDHTSSTDDYAKHWTGLRADGSEMTSAEWPLARSVRTGEVVEGEDIRIIRGDGKEAVIRVSSSPIFDETGAIKAGVVTFFDVTDERREQDALAFLSEASATAGASLLYDETLRRIAHLALPKFADLAVVHLIDLEGNVRRHEAAAADPVTEAMVNGISAAFPVGLLEHSAVLEEAQSVLVPHFGEAQLATIADLEQRAMIEEIGIRSAISVPMNAGGQMFGSLSFALVRTDRVFDSFDLFIAEEIARRAGAAIERSRLFEAEREQRIRAERAAEQLRHLQTLTADLSASLTFEAAVEVVLREARTLTGATIAVVAHLVDDTLQVVDAIGLPAAVLARYRHIPLTEDIPLTQAVNGREPVWIASIEEALRRSPILRDANPGSRAKAWAALPLMVHDRVIGAVGLSFADEQTFGEDDQHFLMSIAGQCALAFERARLFESERHAREEAEHASRAKDEFLAILSHELRTPMTTVIGWADYIRMMHEKDEAITAPIDALRTSARAQARLVDDLLDVSRVVTGKLRIDPRPTDLLSVVHAAMDAVRVSAEGKGVMLVDHTREQRAPIYGDPDRLQQVFMNLLGNAIKFTPAGGHVTVALVDRGEEKDVAVEDTGEGIEQRFLPHVFERFSQASIGDSRRHSGLGLGLSIVQHLVQMHGGKVHAESEGLGKGAKFTVTLPTRPRE